FGELGVVALPGRDERRQHADVATFVVAHELRHDLVRLLWYDRHIAAGTHLGAEFYVEQAQEMMNFRHRGNGGLASAATGALLNGDCRRYPVDGVDIGLARRLHDRPRVGVQRFEVSTLALVEQYVKGEGRLARTRDARDHREGV